MLFPTLKHRAPATLAPRFAFGLAVALAVCCVDRAALSAHDAAELGLPLVQSFRPRDYGDEHNQNWSAVQDRNGVLYVGNRNVVLSYDGFTWRSIPVGGSFVRGLAIDANDRIWVGASNEVGYLDNDGRGGRVFTSLRNKLPQAERDFGDIFQAFAFPHGVYFVTNDRILWWHDGIFTVEHCGRALAHAVGDELVVHVRGQPLTAWRGQEHRIVADFPILRRNENWVTGVAPLPDGTWILATLHGGLWRLAGGALTPFPTEADATLRSGSVISCLALQDGTLALALRPKGLLLLNRNGAVQHYLDVTNGGLPNAALHGLYQDRSGAVWALLDYGLARVNWPEHVTVFNEANGLAHGTIHAVLRHAQTLYVGAFDGLYALQPAEPTANPPRDARFAAVPDCEQNVSALASAGDELLIGGVGGLRVLSPTGKLTRAFRDDVCLALLTSHEDVHVAFVGTAGGLYVFRRTADGWHSSGRVSGIDDDEIRNLVEAPDGALWVSSAKHGFYRIFGLRGTRSATQDPPRIEHYASGHGLGPDPITDLPVVIGTDADPLFLVSERLYRFDQTTRQFSVIAVGEPGTRVAGIGSGLNETMWLRLNHDPSAGSTRKINRIARMSRDGRLDFLGASLAQAAGQSLVFLEEPGPDGASVLWTGGTEAALLRIDVPRSLRVASPFRTLIRRATQPGGTALPLQATTPIVLPYAKRALNLVFATDRLDTEGLHFETRLDDEATWSEPLSGPSVSFNSLSPGRHVIFARASDPDGAISIPAEFAFTILAPWWMTWWAWSAYAIFITVAIMAFVRWRLHALRARAVRLEATVAERTEELRDAKTAAEAANRAKSAFLANMSHELRTPLNAILGYAQILRKETGLTPKGQRQLEIVGRNGEHLLQMINEVLDLAKIEAGKMTLHAAEFPLMRLIKSAADVFELRASDKGLAFRLELGAGLPKAVKADEPKLRQVLFNLLGNAVKFTAEGEVVFAITRTHGLIRFEVRDTGPGIAPEELAAIFQPFHQASPGSAAAQGTGLGLSISQRIIELHGGTIQVESTVDRGSRFWFDLALSDVASQPVPLAARRIIGYQGARQRILVADDEETNRAVLRDLLEPLGFIVDEADDGAACLERARSTPPDAVLLDLRMPTLNGFEAIPRLRALPLGRRLAIIAISASVFDFNQQEALAAGCDDFVPKPVQESRLLDALGRALALVWDWGDSTPPFGSVLAVDDGARPSPADLDGLNELARRGDLDALRSRIAELLAQRHPGENFLRQLDELAAGFKTAEIRQRLAEARQRPPTS